MVKIVEHVWIPMRDGIKLGARLWLPEDAEENPVPAILEYIPYRKRDGTRGRDEPIYGFFAQHGYAGVRVDMRGSGESEGLLLDEYIQQEQDDAVDVIDWIAKQPWCSGNVGMFGKSWGGFNGLQVAACQPPALKAVISCYSTDDRYKDDIHYMGGLLLNDNLWWGTIMLANQCRPLDPEIVGDTWREQWMQRLDALPFWPALWMEHPTYDDYWKHGSICEDWSRVTCPVLAVGGLEDSYTNAVPRLIAGLPASSRGIIGPWGHIYPQDGVPGPAIGFLQECLRWWDQWLKGIDTGVKNDPKLRAYIADNYPPTGTRDYTPGRWVGEAQWPSPNISDTAYSLTGTLKLASQQQGEEPCSLSICSPLSYGKAGGEWMGAGCVGEHPSDQRLDDGGSLNFTSDILDSDIDILGEPVLNLQFSVNQEIAQISLRLCDVHPDGQVARISYQVYNLNHLHGHEHPEKLVPGEIYNIKIPLNVCGYRFQKGHKIRLSLATGYWPMVWPSPKLTTLTVIAAKSQLLLPIRAQNTPELKVEFAPAIHGKDAPITQLAKSIVRRRSEQDHVTGVNSYITEGIGGLFGEGIVRFDDIGTVLDHSLRRHLTIKDNDPNSANYNLTQTYKMGRENWQIDIDTQTNLNCDENYFYLTGQVEVKENNKLVKKHEWNKKFKRMFL